MTIIILSGVMVHKARALSPLPGPTYLTFPQLTTTNQVRKHFQPQKILISGEKCGFSGLGLICSEVGHKNELSCRGVVVRTTSHCWDHIALLLTALTLYHYTLNHIHS